ncbi:uncharacterized protein BDW70DRAFT_167157 [Aspergillus foveolatus]|uniref:uncharacterized protein n=1 Tax=Aspergillus foveolatus TaxID=210207 RepID=UPI003CCDFAC9
MPALIESNSENKRPRRPSITQQLQRMFHIDKPVDAKHDTYEDSRASNPSVYERNGTSFAYVNHGLSEFKSTGNSRHSHSSVNSNATDLHTSQSRHSSLRSVHLEPYPDPLNQDNQRLKSTNHSVVQKKDRRATKRLEAERLELEKRLLKLEEAERTGDTSVLRRESRRLSKKQPLKSSSRSSSVSDDESRSRPTSRLSSLLSSSRRRSRSRCSSIEGVDNHPNGHDESNALPVLSPTLPERLSTAISKELATRKNALLVSPEESSQSLETTTESTSSQPTIRNGEERTLPAPSDNIQSDLSETSRRKDSHQQSDLDRALFTASLTPKNGRALSGHAPRGQIAYRQLEQPQGDNSQLQMNSRSRSMLRNPLSRSPTDGIVQRQQKMFKSSPLAESQTIDVNDVPSKRATTLPSHDIPEAARPQTLTVAEKATSPENHKVSTLQSSSVISENITINPSLMEAREAQNPMSRIPTSKPTSQSAPSVLLVKPRFYNSLNKVTGAGGGKPKATVTMSPPPRERDSFPTVPPKSPKRNSRAMSQSPDIKTNNRPTSSLSNDRSQESESDYNTADEIASTISKISDDCDLQASVGSRVPKHKSTGSEGAAGISNGKGNPKMTKKRNLGQLVPKLFVICCRCKFWHDMPSEVYASLTVSDPLSAALDQELAAWERNSLVDRLLQAHSSHESYTEPPRSEAQHRSSRIRVTTEPLPGPVRCCWCEHQISKGCCQGWSTLVQLRQRHH